MVITAVLGVLALYLFGGLKVLREYERAVYFFLGRSWGAKGPGLIYVPPLFAKTQQVSLRVVALDIPPQDVITRDNISIKVNAVLYVRVKDPVKAVIGVENYLYATSQLAQTTLRSVLGETEMDELLMNREKINAILKNIIDKRTEEWGVEVSAVEVKDVDLPPEMKRAMARQAEAERERRAKIINAEGELQASEKLAQAAHIIGSEPAAIQLRYLQTVTEIASENNSTTIFPLPLELFRGFFESVTKRVAALPEKTAGEPLPAPPRKTEAGAFASIQRALGAGGRRFALARAAEVTGRVTPLETGFCHVQLVADVSNLRRQRLGIAGALFGLGAAATGTFLAMAVLTPFAWAPAVALGAAAVAALGAQRRQYEQVQIGIEQVLDRLERGEIRPEHALPGSRVNAFVRLADEIRSLISPGAPPRG